MICAVEAVQTDILKKSGRRSLTRWFTPSEIKKLSERNDPWQGLAARLALKRAFNRAVAGAGMEVFAYNRIEIFSKNTGQPALRVLPARAQSAFNKYFDTCEVSLSHAGRIGIGMAALSRHEE